MKKTNITLLKNENNARHSNESALDASALDASALDASALDASALKNRDGADTSTREDENTRRLRTLGD